MKKDKPLTKKQYQQYQEELNKEKDIVKYVARILACAFLLGIIIFVFSIGYNNEIFNASSS